jgi:nucleotide-binding universal stress UspA family protein
MRHGRTSTNWVPNLGDMAKLADRRDDVAGLSAEPTRARPVVLATLSVRVDPSAERMAIDSALEAGVPLVLVNVLPFRFYPTTLALVGPEGLNLPHEEDLDAVRATAARAAEMGVKTELLRVTTRRPVQALLEIVSERDAGLLVFGPEPDRVRRRTLRRAFAQVRERAPCLLWTSARVEAAATRR